MKHVFCMIAPNGSGKTEIIKRLIADYSWVKVKLFEGQVWDVIAFPQEQHLSSEGIALHDNKALIVGKYGNRKIGGADNFGSRGFWAAMKIACAYKGADRIIVEALRISKPEFFWDLDKFCQERNLTLHATLIKVDPITCYTRQLQRAAPRATYPLQLVWGRLTRSRYLYEVLPKDRKSIVDNSGDPQVAAENYLKIVFPGETNGTRKI